MDERISTGADARPRGPDHADHIIFPPKLTKTIPAPLAGIALVAALVIALGLDVPRVGDLASIQGGLPAFHIPQVPLTMETLQIIIPYAFILAGHRPD